VLKQRYFANIHTDSLYLSENLVPQREIYEANCHRNNSLLRRWLYNCIDEHDECRQSVSGSSYNNEEDNVLPSRLIDVGALDGSMTPRIIVASEERGLYTVLSHRWGTAPKLTTRKETLELYVKSLPMNELPPTFRDAIEVTRSLRIKYLWIDSLCIIQDDPNDWEAEAAQMGNIFEGACCTIAAIDAIDDATQEDEGLFLPRNRDPLAVRMSCDFLNEQFRDPPSPDDPIWESPDRRLPCSSSSGGNRDVVMRPRWKGLWYTMEDTEWRKRAWILQERILSRRIIYYTKRKLFWECQKFSTDEENRPDTNPPLRAQFISELDEKSDSTRKSDPQDSCLFTFWESQVGEYSSCLLTKETDKLAALQGLSDRVSQRLQRRIFAGMLYDAFGYFLLWQAAKEEPLETYTEFHAPSWSWASLKGPIKYHLYFLEAPPRPQIQDLRMTPAEACLKTKGDKCESGVCGVLTFRALFARATAAEPFSELPSLSDRDMIRILGSVVHCESSPIPRQLDSNTFSISRRKLSLPYRTQVLRAQFTKEAIGWVLLDRGSYTEMQSEILCVVVCLRKAEKIPLFGQPVMDYDYPNEQIIDFIVLEVSAEEPSVYRRVGRGQFVAQGWIDTCEEGDFTLW
jgi:Heterokaryon incompatibility protein (HET)